MLLRWPVLLLLMPLLAACERPVQVSASGFGAFEPALTVVDEGLAVAWYDNRHGTDDIYLRLLDADLRPLTGELRITNSVDSSYEVALAPLGGDLAVAWYDKNVAGELVVQLGRWNRQGAAVWQTALSAPDRNGRVPALERVGDLLFAAWIEEDRAAAGMTVAADTAAAAIYGAWLDSAGNYRVPPFLITTASRSTWNLNTAALPDGRVALVFDAAYETAASELYLAVIDGVDQGAARSGETEAAAVTLVRLGTDDGAESKYPDIAIHGNIAALTWFDSRDGNNEVYLTVAELQSLAGITAGTSEQVGRRITQTAGDSVGAYLAWNGDKLGLAWNDDDSGRHQIYFQSFDTTGQPLQPVRQLTSTRAASRIPAIVPHAAGFALAWNEIEAAGGHDDGQGQARSEIMLGLAD